MATKNGKNNWTFGGVLALAGLAILIMFVLPKIGLGGGAKPGPMAAPPPVAAEEGPGIEYGIQNELYWP